MTDERKPDPSNARPEILPFVSLSIRASIDHLISDWQYDVKFDGSWTRIGIPDQASEPASVDRYLDVEALTERDVLDELMLYTKKRDLKLSTTHLKAGLRKVVRRRMRNWKKSILMPMLAPCDVPMALVKTNWSRVGELFDTSTSLSTNCLGHLIHQVKRKALNLPVTNHLMPIIFGGDQGSGKTTFVRRFASPLSDLASADILLSDFADHRAADIYRYSLAICDDMEQLPKAAVPILKSLITATRINRRQLQTSNSVSMRQAATLIGTANRPVHELIEDETGHRRFVMLPFRNGNQATGGDSDVWKVVDSIDWALLWHSIDAFSPSPILPSLAELHAYQSRYRPTPKLLRWLREIDLHSEEIKAISVQSGVRVDMLRDLYIQQTGDIVSRQRFADEMATYMGDDSVPFSQKFKKEIGAVYRIRSGFGRRWPNGIDDDGVAA